MLVRDVEASLRPAADIDNAGLSRETAERHWTCTSRDADRASVTAATSAAAFSRFARLILHALTAIAPAEADANTKVRAQPGNTTAFRRAATPSSTNPTTLPLKISASCSSCPYLAATGPRSKPRCEMAAIGFLYQPMRLPVGQLRTRRPELGASRLQS